MPYFGPNITVLSCTVNSPTNLTAVLAISHTAAIGQGTVTVTTGSEVVSIINAFSTKASSSGSH
jgi:hypothetical protein